MLITAERQGQNARQMFAAISSLPGNTEIAISVVTLIELAHGAARADTPQRKEKRNQFIQKLLTDLGLLCFYQFGQWYDLDVLSQGISLFARIHNVELVQLEVGQSDAHGGCDHRSIGALAFNAYATAVLK